MKVGLYSPYLIHLGGGERYLLTAAEFFLKRGDAVHLLTDNFEIKRAEERFRLVLANLNIGPAIFTSPVSLFSKLRLTRNFDLIFFASDGSVPLSFAKRNFFHIQQPMPPGKIVSLWERLKLKKVEKILYNSLFTKKFGDAYFSNSGKVLYPPVDIDRFSPKNKKKIIISVGRFDSPSHPKNHLLMIKSFQNLVSNGLRGWKLSLMGGTSDKSGEIVQSLTEEAVGLPVEIETDVTSKKLEKALDEASIYWHAAGYGFDLEKEPQKAEHFGISTVESMAAGCVPIVFGGGGQLEIIKDQKSGLFWKDTEELEKLTWETINNPNQMVQISKEALQESKKFSKKVFFDELDKLL